MIADVIRWLVPIFCEQHNLGSAEDINHGWCELFAVAVCYYIRDATPTWDDEMPDGPMNGTHCFVEYDGRFYDSEAPEGVLHWLELPYFERVLEWNQMNP